MGKLRRQMTRGYGWMTSEPGLSREFTRGAGQSGPRGHAPRTGYTPPDVLPARRRHRRPPERREEHALQPAHRRAPGDHLRRLGHHPGSGVRHRRVERPHVHGGRHRWPRARAGHRYRGAGAGPGAGGGRGIGPHPLRRRRARRTGAARLRGGRSAATGRCAGDPRHQQGRQPRARGRCGRVLRARRRSGHHDQRAARPQHRRPGRPHRRQPPAADRGGGGGIGLSPRT